MKDLKNTSREQTAFVIYHKEYMRLYQLYIRNRITEQEYSILRQKAKIKYNERLFEEISNGDKPNLKIYEDNNK